MSDDIDVSAEEHDRAMAVLFGKGFGKDKAKRKAREKRARSTTDGRTLHATGRTHPWSFRCKEEIKEQAVLSAQAEGITIAEWLESAILAKLGVEG